MLFRSILESSIKYFGPPVKDCLKWKSKVIRRFNERTFRSLFCLNCQEIYWLWRVLWNHCEDKALVNPVTNIDHLMWTLYYWKIYPTWRNFSIQTGIDEKTLSKWVLAVEDCVDSMEHLVRTNSSIILLAAIISLLAPDPTEKQVPWKQWFHLLAGFGWS